MRVIEKVFRLTGKGVLASAEAARKEYLHREYPAPAPVPRGLRKACEVREEQIHGNQVFTLTPRESASGLHILYTHGGGYVHPLMTLHWSIIRKLIESTGATVTAPIYPLAPEHTWAEAYSLLEEVSIGGSSVRRLRIRSYFAATPLEEDSHWGKRSSIAIKACRCPVESCCSRRGSTLRCPTRRPRRPRKTMGS